MNYIKLYELACELEKKVLELEKQLEPPKSGLQNIVELVKPKEKKK